MIYPNNLFSSINLGSALDRMRIKLDHDSHRIAGILKAWGKDYLGPGKLLYHLGIIISLIPSLPLIPVIPIIPVIPDWTYRFFLLFKHM